VRRPNYQQLNPFLSYVDKYTYTAGNPYLNPHENNVFNLEYSYKNYFGVSFAYLYVKNDMYNLTEVEDGIFIIRPENFGVNYSFNLRPYISFSPIKRWHVDADLLLFHLVNKGNAYAQSINNSITTGEFEWNNQFQLKHGWSAELNGFFPGRMGGGQTFSDPVWRIDAGVQKTILKGNGTIRLAANDIFKTLKMRDKTTIPGEATAIHTSETDSRRVGIAFSYRFGKEANGRKRNHNSGGAEDEQGRAK